MVLGKFLAFTWCPRKFAMDATLTRKLCKIDSASPIVVIRVLYSFSIPTITESICVRSMTEVCKPDLLLSPVLDILEYNVDAEDGNLFEMRTVLLNEYRQIIIFLWGAIGNDFFCMMKRVIFVCARSWARLKILHYHIFIYF